MIKVAANWAKTKRRQACLWSLDWEFGPILGPFAFGLDLISHFVLNPREWDTYSIDYCPFNVTISLKKENKNA